MKRLFSIFVLFCCLIATAVAQTINVQGRVTDENEEPTIGATVLVEGTINATMTDVDGNFSLSNVKIGESLIISYIGYESQVIKVIGSDHITIRLKPDSKLLDEVVVVGYGAQKKSSISGAVSTVKADDLPKAGTGSLGEMLRGKAAGMNIVSNSASPGSSLNISVRGGLSGEKPLIVIDGVPQAPSGSIGSGTSYAGSDKDTGLINLNPDDIETINILKDASAAAIYGSDASGGVILITTKRGQSGKPSVSYSGSVAMQFIKDAPEFLDARGFMIEQNKVFDELGRGNEKKFSQSQIDNFVGKGTDWLDEVTRVGVVNEHNLSVTAGSDNTKYLFSASYFDHKGITKNTDMNRITGRVNIDQTFSKQFKAGINTSFSQIKYHDAPMGEGTIGNSSLIYSALTFLPTVPVRDQDGKYSINPYRDMFPNPVSLLDIEDQTLTRNLFLSGYLEYKPFDCLTFRATGGADMKDSQRDQYIPTTTKKGFAMNGQGSKQNSKAQMNLINIIGTFNKNFAEKHDLNVMLGWEYKESSWNGMGIVAQDFPYDGALMNNIGISQQENPDISSYKSSKEMASFMGRVNYTFRDRYIATVNVRVDGSSNFSPKHQWGTFPGVSLAWRINEENFMDNLTWISNLKLRAGYGQTGNAGSLTGINTYYSVNRGAYVFDGSLTNGIGLSKLGNPNLKWETLTDINIGLDFGFINNRLSGTLDFYQRTRKDVIMSKSLMSYQEIKYIDYNSKAQHRSQGVDLGLSSVNIDTRNFTWSTELNVSYYRNKTIKRDPDFIPEVYQPWVETWNDHYAFRTDGFLQEGETLAHLPSSTAGAIKYLDLYGYKLDENGERVRDAEGRYIRTEGPDGVLDDADKVKLFNSTPIPFSINNTFRWKNWDANIYIYGSLNGWKMNDIRYQTSVSVADMTYGQNALSEIRNRWSPQNPSGTLPGVAEASSAVNSAGSDFYYERSWYLRLDNVSIGYTMPSHWFKNNIKSLRVYAAARNLCVFTPYKGMDPETGNGYSAYPNQSSVAVGLNLNF